MGWRYVLLVWARHFAHFMGRPYVGWTLCWVDLVSGWPYVMLTLCKVKLMLGEPYVESTLCRVDLMSGRPYVKSTLCRVNILSLNCCMYFKVSTVVWCGGLGFKIELWWRYFFSILVPLFSTLGEIFNSIFWSHWSLFVSQHAILVIIRLIEG